MDWSYIYCPFQSNNTKISCDEYKAFHLSHFSYFFSFRILLFECLFPLSLPFNYLYIELLLLKIRYVSCFNNNDPTSFPFLLYHLNACSRSHFFFEYLYIELLLSKIKYMSCSNYDNAMQTSYRKFESLKGVGREVKQRSNMTHRKKLDILNIESFASGQAPMSISGDIFEPAVILNILTGLQKSSEKKGFQSKWRTNVCHFLFSTRKSDSDIV